MSGVGGAWVAANLAGIEEAQAFVQQAASSGRPPAFAFFTAAQAVEVEAMAAQIIPTDSTPGAREARVVHFIDRALTTFEKARQADYVKGLDELAAQTKQLVPTAPRFSALTSEQQIQVLTAMERSPFFNLVRTHTITGFVANPHSRRQRREGRLEARGLRRLDALHAAVRLLRRASREPAARADWRTVMAQFTPSTEVDFVIIGSGAAGGIMAKQLSVAGYSVVVLEQGGWGKYGKDREYTKDEWLNDMDPDAQLMTDPVTQPNTFRRTDKEKAGPGSHSYGCVVGGGTVTYGGSSWRHLPWEFNEVTQLGGAPSGSNLADWPISYAELEPYYVQAEWEMGISGERINSPHVAPMSKEYPVPPVPLKASGALMKTGAAKLGWNVVRGPLAIITKPYQGRDACVNCSSCSGFGCHVRARSSSAVAMLPLAEKTGRCEIRVRSYVREIATDAGGKVTGVVYFDANKREVRQQAKAVILSANATESPRLLLLSKSARFPNGLANSSGIVGQNLMLGNTVSASGLFEHPLNDYKGVVTGAGIVDFIETDPKRGFYGGGRMTARGFDTPINYALRGLSPGTARWGALYKKALARGSEPQDDGDLLRDAAAAREQPHRPRSGCEGRVGTAGDALDVNQPSRRHQEHGVLPRALAGTAARCWSHEGVGVTGQRQPWQRAQPRHLPDGERSGTSVVNKFHRAHDVPNLFIVDGSNLVTGGRNHPTMTIQALAFRAAEHIIRAAKTGQMTRL